jgi:uncharacterized protein YcaQ
MVRSAHSEGVADASLVARELAAELIEMAGWLGLSEIEVGPAGDLSDRLARRFS